MKSSVNIVLLSLCCFLAYQLYQSARPDVYVIEPVESGKSPIDIHIAKDVTPEISPLGQYTAMVQRPLFYESRKPLVKKKTVVKSKPARVKKPASKSKPFDAFLSAIILTDDKKLALLTDAKSKVTEKVYLGESILGWEVTGITPRTVTLAKDDETKTLVLEIVGSSGQPPSPPSGRTGTGNELPDIASRKNKSEPVSDH